MRLRGGSVVSLRESWARHLEKGWLHWALVWEGQGDGEAQVARQLAVARREPHRPRTLHLTPGRAVVLVEWRGALGALCKAGARRGAIVWMHGAAGAPGAGHSLWPPGVAEWTTATCQKVDVVAASLTNDDGEEARRWANFIIQVGAEVVIADAPKTAELGPATAKLKSEGYSWEEVEVNSSELGDATSRYRRIVAVVKGGGEPTSLGQECVEPMSVRSCVG